MGQHRLAILGQAVRAGQGHRQDPRGGTIFGATDELGMEVAENPLGIRDLHATMLHLLGLDHERLTFRFAGRDMRLTDVEGRVIEKILA